MGRFRVSVGEDFEVEGVDLSDQTTRDVARSARLFVVEKARQQVAYVAGAACMAALAVAFVLGVPSGNYSAVAALWSELKLPLGFIFGYYFMPTKSP
jgi:hypothetical protein